LLARRGGWTLRSRRFQGTEYSVPYFKVWVFRLLELLPIMDVYRKLESTSTLNSFTLSSSGIISLRRTCKKMKRIYFDLDNPAFIAWLKTRPTDTYDVLLGSDMPDESVDLVFSKVATEGVDLTKWLAEKLQRGEMQINVNTKVELPQGIVLE
jgi:hypothetical protein